MRSKSPVMPVPEYKMSCLDSDLLINSAPGYISHDVLFRLPEWDGLSGFAVSLIGGIPFKTTKHLLTEEDKAIWIKDLNEAFEVALRRLQKEW